LFFSCDKYKNLLGDFHQELITAIKDLGKKAFFHSDGDINSILENLIGYGIDAIHPLEPKFYDIKAIIDLYDITCIGGISYTDTLKDNDLNLFKNSKYIYSAYSAILDDISLYKYKEFVDLARLNYEYKN